MDDVYCPVCRLVVERRGCGVHDGPLHCPRCLARREELVAMLQLDMLPPASSEQTEPARPGG